MRRRLLAFALLAACGGEDDATPPPAAPQPGAPGAKPGAPGQKDDKNKLQPRMHAEDKVLCPIPDKPTGVDCKPDTPICDPGLYCLPTTTANKFTCEACP